MPPWGLAKATFDRKPRIETKEAEFKRIATRNEEIKMGPNNRKWC
jgi:hypothetical protein